MKQEGNMPMELFYLRQRASSSSTASLDRRIKQTPARDR